MRDSQLTLPPTTNKSGHFYWMWDISSATFMSRSFLVRVHRNHMHPSSMKLYNLLSRSKPECLRAHNLPLLKYISRRRATCQTYSPKQFFSRKRDPDGIRCSHKLPLNLMYLENDGEKQRAVLLIVDVGTKFQAVAFIPSHSVAKVCKTFLVSRPIRTRAFHIPSSPTKEVCF